MVSVFPTAQDFIERLDNDDMTTLENNLAVSYKGNMYLPYDPANAPPSCTRTVCPYKDLYTNFIAPLFIITKN